MCQAVDVKALGGDRRPMSRLHPLAFTVTEDGSPPATRRRTASVRRRRPRGKAGSWGTFFLFQAIVAAFLFTLSYTDSAHAYAWMIKHNYTACGTCHADPSGGELLTHYGRVTSDLILRTHYGSPDVAKDSEAKSEAKDEGPPTGVFWGALDLPKQVLLSGSYRNLYIVRPKEDEVFTLVPVMQLDVYGQLRFGAVTMGGSVGLGKAPVDSPHVRAAQITANQGEGLNLISRNHYVGVDIGSSFILRAGRLNLPFGIRMPEHTTWVREATRTDRESDQQHGLALAYVGENLRAEIMGIAGNFQTKLVPGGEFGAERGFTSDSVRERGYSMYVEGISGTNFAAGVTSKVTYAQLDRVTFEEKSLRQAHGLTMRYAPAKFLSFLAEADALFRTNANTGYVGFAQADVEPIQGLHFMLTGEFLDQGLAVQSDGEPTPIASPGLGEPRFGGWLTLDWFFYRQFEFRTDLLFRQNEPLTLLGQLHFYL